MSMSTQTGQIRDLGKDARTRKVRRILTVNAPQETTFSVVRNVHEYNQFLPWVDHVEDIPEDTESTKVSDAHRFAIHYKFDQVGGMDLSRLFGAKEIVAYELIAQPYNEITSKAKDTLFCEAITYKWKFEGLSPSNLPSNTTPTSNAPRCRIRLDFEIVFKSFLHAPAWDIVADAVIQQITNAMISRALVKKTDPLFTQRGPGRLKQKGLPESNSNSETQTLPPPTSSLRSNLPNLPDPSQIVRGPLIAMAMATTHQPPSNQNSTRHMDIWDLPASVMNLAASVAGVPHRVSVRHEKNENRGGESSERARVRATRALDVMPSEEINRYAKTMIRSGRLKMAGFGMSDEFQSRLYAHSVKIMLCLVHEGMWSIDGASVFGYQVVLQQLRKHARTRLEREGGWVEEQHCTMIDRKVLEDFVDSILEEPTLNSPFIPDVIERVVYLNCVIVVFNLIADLSQGVKISFMGHKLTWRFEPETLVENQKPIASSPDLEIPEGLIFALVDEIINDDDINVTWIPDAIEREFYVLITRFIARVVAQILDQMTVTVMGMDAKITLTAKSGLEETDSR